jgi:hypothetical protein
MILDLFFAKLNAEISAFEAAHAKKGLAGL